VIIEQESSKKSNNERKTSKIDVENQTEITSYLLGSKSETQE